MGGIGYHSHQQEAASTYRSHHQERGCRLGEIAQPREGDAEDGREHDCLEKIVAHQGYQRHDAQIAKHQTDADHAAHGTDEEHGGCLDMAHDPAAQESAYHEERQGEGEDERGGAVAHPMHAGDEIDEVGIDGDLGYLVTQEGEETEDEHPVVGKELGDITALRLVFRRLLVLDFRQIDTGEHHGDGKHQNAQDGIRYDHIAALLRIIEEELTDAEGGKDAAQTIERLREVQSAGSGLPGTQFGNVWIGGCFEEHQSASDDEEAEEEGREAAYRCPRNKEDGAQTEEQEAEHHAPAITILIDEEARRYSHEEITQIGSYLNQGRLGDTDVQGILEVLVEHIENGTREAPQEEERRDENERDKIFLVAH